MYRYKQTEEELWTVGCDVDGHFHPESDHGSAAEAAAHTAHLNGASDVVAVPHVAVDVTAAVSAIDRLTEQVRRLADGQNGDLDDRVNCSPITAAVEEVASAKRREQTARAVRMLAEARQVARDGAEALYLACREHAFGCTGEPLPVAASQVAERLSLLAAGIDGDDQDADAESARAHRN